MIIWWKRVKRKQTEYFEIFKHVKSIHAVRLKLFGHLVTIFKELSIDVYINIRAMISNSNESLLLTKSEIKYQSYRIKEFPKEGNYMWNKFLDTYICEYQTSKKKTDDEVPRSSCDGPGRVRGCWGGRIEWGKNTDPMLSWLILLNM